MKRKLCILVLLLNSLSAVWACITLGDFPENYRFYNVCTYRENPVFYRPDYTHTNLMEWRQYAGGNISTEQVAEVVYKFTVTDMQHCMQNPKIKRCQDNAFATYIFTDSVDYAARLLLLAKQVEYTRAIYNDPWYYPASKNESTLEHLRGDICEMIKEVKTTNHNSHFFYERLQLQHVRVLFAQAKYQECIQLWEKDVKNWDSNSLMQNMIKSYIAGAYAQTGAKSVACQYFFELDNYQAIADLSFTQQKGYTEFIRTMYDCNPDCADIVAPALQNELIHLGQHYYTTRRPDSIVCAQYYDLMQYIIRTHRSKEMSLWYYTTAYLEDYMGKTQKAAQSIHKAMQYATNEEMKSNIRLMRMYLDAKTKKYDSQYEQQLYADLRWIDNMIKKDTARLQSKWNEYDYLGTWEIHHNKSCDRSGKYYCYPYTMLRKIVLGEVAPRMKNAGKTSLSIALSNYAENMLFAMLEPKHQHCFHNGFFMAMDTMPAKIVEKYVQIALNPQSDLERFLSNGGYVDKNYLYDIVGTLYLRERNYKKAMEILSYVEPSYQFRLNTCYNLKSDPFALDVETDHSRILDSKYNFACEMYNLQQVFQNEKIDPNRRANAMLSFAIGMRNSYIKVWALTQYSQGEFFIPGHQSWLTKEREEQVKKDYDEIVTIAFSMFTNDESTTAAYLRYRNNYTIVTQYPNTATAKYIRSSCDTYYDYYPVYTPKK